MIREVDEASDLMLLQWASSIMKKRATKVVPASFQVDMTAPNGFDNIPGKHYFGNVLYIGNLTQAGFSKTQVFSLYVRNIEGDEVTARIATEKIPEFNEYEVNTQQRSVIFNLVEFSLDKHIWYLWFYGYKVYFD